MPVSSLRLVFSGFNQLWRPILRLHFNKWDMKSWHVPESKISELNFRRDVGWKTTGDSGWKLFPPSIKPLSHALKTLLLIVHFKGFGSATHLYMHFPQYLHTPSTTIPSTNHSSLRAHGHVGCWVEFYTTSVWGVFTGTRTTIGLSQWHWSNLEQYESMNALTTENV